MSRVLRALAVVATLAACSSADAGFTVPVAMMSSPANDFDFDLTNSTLPTGLTMARTGSTIYAARSASTAVAVSGADVYEDRGDGRGGGHWVFDAYVNSAPPFDFTLSPWDIPFGALTITPSIGAGPDGSTQGSRIDDTVGGRILYILDWSVTNDQHAYNSMWVRDSSVHATLGGSWNAGDDSYGVPFGSGASWHRISSLYVKSSSATQGVKVRLYPAGATPDPRSASGAITYDATKTGAIEAWGAQATLAAGDVPLVDGSTGAATLSVNTPAKALLPNGDIYIEGAYLFQGTRYTEWEQPAWTLGDQFAFKAATTGGDQALYWDIGSGMWYAKKGDGSTTSGIALFNHLYYDHEVRWEYWNRPSVGDGGANIWFNGCRFGGASNVSGMRWSSVTQTAPTSFYLNSDAGSANSFMVAPVTELRRIDQTITGRRSVADPEASEGVILADSIMAAHAYAGPMTGAYIYTFDEGRSRLGIISYANTGDSVNDQFTAWINGAQRGRADVKWVFIQLGANDLFGGRTESQIVSDTNALIADINTQNPNTDIILSPLTPMRGALSGGQYTIWQALQLDYAGTGSFTFTGSHLHILPTSTWATLNDGSDNLATVYQEPFTDGVHINDVGRITVQAPAIRAELISLGHL